MPCSSFLCAPVLQGGLARFINHCCDPNCYTKIVTVDNAKHILIFSKRAIPAGEELSYDYKVMKNVLRLPTGIELCYALGYADKLCTAAHADM